MPFDYDNDDIAHDFNFEIFNSRLMRRFYSEIEEIFKEIKNGKLKGTLETREIDEPGITGFIIHGRFGSKEAPEPFEPLKPLKRRPLPEKPFELSRDALKETREPLTDVFEQESSTKIYVELPGEEEKNIELRVKDGAIEVKSEHFYQTIDLRDRHLDKQKISSKYKNGVLEITVPKQTKFQKYSNEEKLV
jgi:HSP20 family molecular chaperone IbpA